MRAFALVVGLGSLLLLGGQLQQARADACEDADGRQVSVTGTISEIEKDGDGSWWISLREDLSVDGCLLDGIVVTRRPPGNCAVGRTIEASGEFVDLLFEVFVDATSYSCY